MEGFKCLTGGFQEVYSHLYMIGIKFYGVHLRNEKQASISELLSPVKIPFITVVTMFISIVLTLAMNTLGYDAEKVDFTNYKTPDKPMYFFGSLAGIIVFVYVLGR